MAKYRVYVPVFTSVSVDVDLEDGWEDEFFSIEEALGDAAYNLLPGSLCFQCAGYRQPWSRDEGEPDWDNLEYDKLED